MPFEAGLFGVGDWTSFFQLIGSGSGHGVRIQMDGFATRVGRCDDPSNASAQVAALDHVRLEAQRGGGECVEDPRGVVWAEVFV